MIQEVKRLTKASDFLTNKVETLEKESDGLVAENEELRIKIRVLSAKLKLFSDELEVSENKNEDSKMAFDMYRKRANLARIYIRGLGEEVTEQDRFEILKILNS